MEILDKIQRNKIENFIGKFSRWVHENIKTDSGIHFTINITPENKNNPAVAIMPHLIVTALIPIDRYSRFYDLLPIDTRAKYPSGLRPYVISINQLDSTDNPISFSATMGFHEFCRMLDICNSLSEFLWEN